MNDNFEISGRSYSREQMQALQELADWADVRLAQVFMVIDGLDAIFEDEEEYANGRQFFFSACMTGEREPVAAV
jgi:hypothetical protein